MMIQKLIAEEIYNLMTTLFKRCSFTIENLNVEVEVGIKKPEIKITFTINEYGNTNRSLGEVSPPKSQDNQKHE